MPREDTQFKKGNCANPKGRPKGSVSYKDALKRVMEAESMKVELVVNGKIKKIEVKSKGRNFYDGVAVVQVMEALKGNQQAIKEITNRLEGMPTQQIEQTNINPEPLKLLVDKETAERLNSIE